MTPKTDEIRSWILEALSERDVINTEELFELLDTKMTIKGLGFKDLSYCLSYLKRKREISFNGKGWHLNKDLTKIVLDTEVSVTDSDDDKEYLTYEPMDNLAEGDYKQSPFHLKPIKKGKYGQLSKIKEELDEAYDAAKQGQNLMLLIELADIVGACGGVAETLGMSLDDLIKFAKLRSKVAIHAIEQQKKAEQEKLDREIDNGEES